ncbi:hypothetical protein D3C80_1364820 [compost metagenome]
MIELLGMRVFERVSGVDAIDLGCLEHDIGIDFDCTQAGCRIRRKERVAGTGRENHHVLGVQVTHGLATIVVIGHANHGNSGHHDGRDVGALKGVAHGQGVHHSGQHAHVVAGDPVHASLAQRFTAEQVATTDNQANLNADADQLANFQCHAIQNFRIDPELFRAHQGLAAKLE